MADRGQSKAYDEKDRIILAQHRECRREAGGHRPSDIALFKGPQKAIGGERPGREQDRVGVESLGVKLVDRRQHQQQQHQQSLVTAREATRDQINGPQRDGRVGQSHQMKRPVGEWKDRRPRPRDPSHQRGVLRIAPFEAAPHRPGFQHVGVQIAPDIGDAEIDQPDGDKSDQQTRDDPSRFGFSIGQPAEKTPSPARRASFHIRGRSLGTQDTQNSSVQTRLQTPRLRQANVFASSKRIARGGEPAVVSAKQRVNLHYKLFMSQFSKLGVPIEIMFCGAALMLSARIFASRGWPEKDNIDGTSVRFVVKQHRTLKH